MTILKADQIITEPDGTWHWRRFYSFHDSDYDHIEMTHGPGMTSRCPVCEYDHRLSGLGAGYTILTCRCGSMIGMRDNLVVAVAYNDLMVIDEGDTI